MKSLLLIENKAGIKYFQIWFHLRNWALPLSFSNASYLADYDNLKKVKPTIFCFQFLCFSLTIVI